MSPPPELDVAALMGILGIEPDVFYLRWARTVQVGAAGSMTLSLDLDVRKLTHSERGFVRALCQTLGELIALSEQRTDPYPEIGTERYISWAGE